MIKFLFLVLLAVLFLQTPFYKDDVAPQYKKFEVLMTKLLYSKPEDLKKMAAPDNFPQQPVISQPSSSNDNTDDSVATFMPKSASGGSAGSAKPNVLKIKY